VADYSRNAGSGSASINELEIIKRVKTSSVMGGDLVFASANPRRR